MAGWQDFWFGGTQQIGSPSDVKMLNQQQYNDFMNQLSQAMGGFKTGMEGNLSQAQRGYQDVMGTAGNYENFAKQMLGQFNSLAGATDNFNPQAASNAFLSQQPELARLANQNISGALSDVYSTGRAQATAAANQARRQAASDLAAAGLLGTGAGIGSMTEATVNPQLQMETQLAGMRSQALQNQLGQLQGQTGSLLGQGYSNAAQMAQNLAGLGLQGYQGQTRALEAGSQGLTNIGNIYGGQYGQGLGLQGYLNQPQYWAPQYSEQTGLGQRFGSAATGALSGAAVGSIIPGIGTAVGAGIGGLAGFFA